MWLFNEHQCGAGGLARVELFIKMLDRQKELMIAFQLLLINMYILIFET